MQKLFFLFKVDMKAHKSEENLKSQCHKTNVAETRIQCQILHLEAHCSLIEGQYQGHGAALPNLN